MVELSVIIAVLSPAFVWAGHKVRCLGDGVKDGSTARRESPTVAAQPVVADDGQHRAPAGRRDHRAF